MDGPNATVDRSAPAEPADADLLADVVAGRLEALEALYDRYRAVAYAIALRVTTDASLAEDVLQEAFLGAWRNADRYVDGRGTVKTWLLAIVHHRAVDAVRRRRPTSDLPETDDRPPRELTIPDVWSEVSGRLDAETVRSALAALPPPQREALELAYYGGLTQQEIAVRTDTPLGTVKSRMRLGLLSLRRAIEDAVRVAEPTGSAER
jgi:RNA polymerase sigma-70 factor (ECF subfamily)